MPISNLLFDLDGTLIDSAPSILNSYAAAFAACDLKPIQPLSPAVVGPPLRSTLMQLLGRDDDATLDALVVAFKDHYDGQGYRESRVYPGIGLMLADLAGDGIPLFLATNKRWKPTALILDHLGWRSHFRAAYALDSVQPPAPRKGALLRWLAQSHALAAVDCLYIGDRPEDGEAAREASMTYLNVPWGYGDALGNPADATVVASLEAQLRDFLERR